MSVIKTVKKATYNKAYCLWEIVGVLLSKYTERLKKPDTYTAFPLKVLNRDS